MEIRKSDRGLLMEIEAWLSFNRAPETKDLADLKAGILHHLQSTEGETSSWAAQSRQLTTEAVNLSARPLATKFVADEAVGLVKELGRALKNIAGFDHFISEEKARGVFIANVYPALAKAAQFTAAIAPTAPTVGKRFVRNDLNGNAIFEGDTVEYQLRGGMYLNKGTVAFDDDMGAFVMLSDNDIRRYLPLLSECNVFSLVPAATPTAPAVGAPTEPQILPPVDAVPEYVPDWPGVPEPFDHVAVDEDGRVFCFVGCPERRPANGVWYPMSGQYKDVSYITEIPEPPGDTWKQMIYQRPK